MGSSGAQTGGVTSVSAADTTIIVTGGPTAPTIKAHTGTTAGTVAAGNDPRFGKINDVTVTGTPTAGQVPIASGPTAAAWGTPSGGGGSGSGDVVGPAGATSGHLALFDGATGKLLKDGGVPPPAPATAAPADLAAAAAVGSSAKYAREDHVHKRPAPADIGAIAVTSGVVVVFHGSNANEPRPAGAAVVYWIGTVAPNNGAAHDGGDGW